MSREGAHLRAMDRVREVRDRKAFAPRATRYVFGLSVTGWTAHRLTGPPFLPPSLPSPSRRPLLCPVCSAVFFRVSSLIFSSGSFSALSHPVPHVDQETSVLLLERNLPRARDSSHVRCCAVILACDCDWPKVDCGAGRHPQGDGSLGQRPRRSGALDGGAATGAAPDRRRGAPLLLPLD